MSNVSKPCNPKAGSGATLKAYDDCNLEFDLAIEDLPNIPEIDVQEAIANSPTVAALKAKDQQLQDQIKGVKETDIARLVDKTNNNQAAIAELNDRGDWVDQSLSEVNDNIAMLKGWNVRQDSAIKGLSTKVIVDKIYNNFEEWVENVYIPQCDQITNKYSRWDIYINANQSVAATNATYINVRNPNATTECSANDWQEQYYSAPADVITYLGIDPLEVAHPYKHEWVVSINPDKFQDFMAGLQRLDLSNVELSLGEVYFDPVFKESAKIQENLEVWNTTKTKDLNVTGMATIAHWDIGSTKINAVTSTVTFGRLATFNEGIQTSTLDVTGSAAIENAALTGSTTVERFDWTVNLSDDVNVWWDLDVQGTWVFQWAVRAHDIHATDHLALPASGHITINGVNFEDWLVAFGNQHWQQR